MVQLSYDAIVIGAGPAGLTAGLEAAASGARVLILEKRNSEDSAQRFQAVVLDAQSQINLRNLGVSLNCLVPLHQALVFDRHWQVDGHTRYAEQPPQHYLPSCSDLDIILGRRHITSVTAIHDLENALLDTCAQHPNIHIHHGMYISHLQPASHGVVVQAQSATHSVSAFGNMLAICDGANSDLSGALNLLGICKAPLAEPVDTMICRFSQPTQPGIVRIRTQVERCNNLVVAFDLKHEQIVYAGYPMRSYDPTYLAQHLAHQMQLPGQLLQAPLVVTQQAKLAPSFNPHPHIFVLGDAALSGTAPLGVYLNKAISDGRAFGEVCQARRDPRAFWRAQQLFAQRRAHPKLSQLIWEETMVAWLFNNLHTLPPEMQMQAVAELLPRFAFRWKVKRGSTMRMMAVNAVDTYGTLFSTASDVAGQMHLRPLKNLMAASAVACRHLQNALE